MALSKSIIRQSHFLGTKVRNLRKRNHLTMEDLSARCIRINPEYAPSVSYLSMIERGKRVPSIEMLKVIAQVFQKDPNWFLDDQPEAVDITPNKGTRGGITGMALEPGFLFSEEILQIAIPEMLSQTGISGRQFAQLLIRAHQESLKNHFPDLERAAENIGQKQLNLTVEDLIDIAHHLGLSIHWFSEASTEVKDELGLAANRLVTSYFEPPGSIYLNELMKPFPTRIKYDLAVYISITFFTVKKAAKPCSLSGTPTAGKRIPLNRQLTISTQLICFRHGGILNRVSLPAHYCVPKYHSASCLTGMDTRFPFMKRSVFHLLSR